MAGGGKGKGGKNNGKSDKKTGGPKPSTSSMNDKNVADGSTEFFLCLVCDDDAEDDSIQCHDCKQWVHFSCSGLTNLQVSFLTDSPDAIQWVCQTCIKGGGEKKGH